ncbi:MAG: Smr/MutS family protein [Patescibacteria group bacterium]|jgi:DNA-nicking Smr family endonuclease
MKGSKIRLPKRNKYRKIVDDVLDLHGFYKIEAEEAVISFLAEASRRGYQLVRVITGKGIHSIDGRGVLNDFVYNFLRDRGYQFNFAKINEGGEGAFDINLKR